MNPRTEKETHRMTWEEVDTGVNTLVDQVSSYFLKRNQRIDVIAPLLRTGGIVGGMLAIKMKILTMLPVQFKYAYHPTRINQLTSIPDILTEHPEAMNILLCEGNTNTGSLAVQAASAIHEKYPHATLYLATLTKVYGGPTQLDGIENIFFGRLTDENFKASAEEKIQLNLREGITIFPWEHVEHELEDINANISFI